jgi:biopolymer transport protein ExbD
VKRQKTEDVDIPITPMLDMAFQLLCFFVLTYHPAPTEGQFSMNLLPAQPAVKADSPAVDTNATTSDLPAEMKTMPVILTAAGDGSLGQITMGESPVADLKELAAQVKETFSNPTLPFDQTVLKTDPRLKWSEVVKVINVFSDNKVNKISFAELGAGEGGSP